MLNEGRKLDCKQDVLDKIKESMKRGLLDQNDMIVIGTLKSDIESKSFEEFLEIKGDDITKEDEINTYSVFISKKKDNRFVRAIIKTDSENVELVKIVHLKGIDTDYYNST